MSFVPLMSKAQLKGPTSLQRYFNTRAVIRNSNSCKLEKCVVWFIWFHLLLLFISRSSKLMRLLRSITCTCSGNDVHERNDLHNSTQILSFILAFLSWKCSAMSSKKAGLKDLRKSIGRKKEVSRETSRCYWENLKSLHSNDEESGEMSEMSPFLSQMAKTCKIDDVWEKLPRTSEKKKGTKGTIDKLRHDRNEVRERSKAQYAW